MHQEGERGQMWLNQKYVYHTRQEGTAINKAKDKKCPCSWQLGHWES